MKRIFLTCIALSLLSIPLLIPDQAHASLPDRVIVRFRPTVSATTQDTLIKQYKVTKKGKLRLSNSVVLTVPQGQATNLAKQLTNNPNVLYAEQDSVAQDLDIPN